MKIISNSVAIATVIILNIIIITSSDEFKFDITLMFLSGFLYIGVEFLVAKLLKKNKE